MAVYQDFVRLPILITSHVQKDLRKDSLESPADVTAPYFQNGSCDPFTPRETTCALGNEASYSVNVSSVESIQAGVHFARKHNIRLVIKNTGHEYVNHLLIIAPGQFSLRTHSLLGKSTGKGSLSLWTHNLDTIEFTERYSGLGDYAGPAVRVGAGVTFENIFDAANRLGLRILGGTCPTVGFAGGFTSGGGHGILTSVHGLAADSVLEWEVVTADGVHLVATPFINSELYWALSGGGAGTFAVVVSMTARAYRDEPMSGANTYLDTNMAGGSENFWDAVTAFQSSLGHVVDAGAVVAYSILPTAALNVYAIAVPDGNLSRVDEILEPVKTAVEDVSVPLAFNSTNHAGFLDLYNSYFKDILAVTPEAQVTGGRMVPRQLLEDAATADAVTQSFRTASEAGFVLICVALNANKRPEYPNSVFPLWRSALLQCVVSSLWDFTAPRADMLSRQQLLTETIMPQIEAATPSGGSYMNEANFQQPNWQEVFYGSNYGRLKTVKEWYDPAGLFYAQTAVGSDAWVQDAEGRLCQV